MLITNPTKEIINLIDKTTKKFFKINKFKYNNNNNNNIILIIFNCFYVIFEFSFKLN